MSLPLHKTKGVNPHMTYCPRCGGETQELVLMGALDFVAECHCGMKIYGGGLCPKCGLNLHRTRRPLEDNERIPASQPCDTCQTEMKEHAAIVAAGGVYWRCTECNQSGVIKPSPFVSHVREVQVKQGLIPVDKQNSQPCGVEFTKCSEHTPAED